MAKVSKAKGTTIAWRATKGRNLYFARIVDPKNDDWWAVCPLVAQGGKMGYVLSRGQAEACLLDEEIEDAVKNDIRYYLDNNTYMESAVVIEVWLDERPEWL